MNEIETRLEQKLGELIDKQYSSTASMFDPGLSREINDLEWIRGRKWIKCLICGTDLTLKLCKHHKKGGKYYKRIKQKEMVQE